MTEWSFSSAIYGGAWATLEMRALFADIPRTRSWLDLLSLLAEVQAEHGLIPVEAAQDIRATCSAIEIDADFLSECKEGFEATSHSTYGLIAAVARRCSGSGGEWFYFGTTVQDLADTWLMLTLRKARLLLIADLERAIAATEDLCRRHRDTIMAGRTHGQQGLPITFGFKAAGWLAELRRHRHRFEEVGHRMEAGQLCGGGGSLSDMGPDALVVQKHFLGRLGLREPDMSWTASRDVFVEWSKLLVLTTGTADRIGHEIYNLQRDEIGELRERKLAKGIGSITMPHKRNPEMAEHLGTLARVVRANAGVLAESLVHGHERDGRSWKVEWHAVPELTMAAGKAHALLASLLAGLEVCADRMRANLDAAGGYSFSEGVMLALARRVGKQTAYRIVHLSSPLRSTAILRRRGRKGYGDLRLSEPGRVRPIAVRRCPDRPMPGAGRPHPRNGTMPGPNESPLGRPSRRPSASFARQRAHATYASQEAFGCIWRSTTLVQTRRSSPRGVRRHAQPSSGGSRLLGRSRRHTPIRQRHSGVSSLPQPQIRARVSGLGPCPVATSALIPEVSDAIIAAGERARQRGSLKPIHVCWVAPKAADSNREKLRAAGVACHAWPAATAAVLAATASRLPRPRAPPAASAPISLPYSVDDAGWVASAAAFTLLQKSGFTVARWATVTDPAGAATMAAALKFPVVLKAERPGLTHKSDTGAVRLGLQNGSSVAEAFEEFCRQLGPGPALLQHQVEPGVELVIGARRDPLFGPIVMAGLGGIWAEALDDVALRLAPVDASEARTMLDELKAQKLLGGFRGRPSIDRDRLASLIADLSQWFCAADWLGELDLNPIIADGTGFTIVDARMRVGERSMIA